MGCFGEPLTIYGVLNTMRVCAAAFWVNPMVTSSERTAPDKVLMILFVVFMIQWVLWFAVLTLISGIPGKNGSAKRKILLGRIQTAKYADHAERGFCGFFSRISRVSRLVLPYRSAMNTELIFKEES